MNTFYDHLSGYKLNPSSEENVQDLERELVIIRKSFQLINPDFNRGLVERIRNGEIKLPDEAERWTFILRWDMVASTYGEAVEMILVLTNFFNHRVGQLGPQCFRQHERTDRMFAQIYKTQKSDILVVPVQFGKRYAGCSVSHTRERFADNEFGLGSFAIGNMMLTHLKKLPKYDDFWVDCAGDEYAGVEGNFSRAPSYSYSDGGLRYDTHRIIHSIDEFGPASGFVPCIPS